jgi:hypothetical protein|tara:strand:- start:178 stop:402 length:225 start_codon:yes stop_codon:yes gene_type:complete
MNTPYTTRTGIKIGSRYNESPKPQMIDDMDMLRLQRALIFSGRAQKQDNLVMIKNAFVLGGILLLIVAVFWMKK